MVQRDQWDTYWGPKKLIFLIRDIDDATMAGASVESCRFVVLRCPGGRLGWYNTCAIAYAAYAAASRVRYISHGPLRYTSIGHDLPKISIQSSLGSPKHLRMRSRRLPDPDLSQRESASRSASEKSVQFGPDGAPFPSKTSITRGPPVVAVAVSLDPILPQR